MPYQTLDAYQRDAIRTAVYRDRTPMRWLRLFYSSLGLAGEAGEVANKVKKIMRDDGSEITPDRRQQILDELGDVLWYVALVADELDATLSSVATANIEKLQARHGHQG